MGNCGTVADNQVVEHQSGASRLCNSILCAICIAPLVLLGGMVLLGWNEQRAVCDAKAIVQGKEEVMQVGCTSAGEGAGSLIIFSCDLLKDGLAPLTAPMSDFQGALSYVGTGLSIKAEMYQCVEAEHTQTQKDSVGGGTTTTKTYTYSKSWQSTYVSSGAFVRKNSDNFRQNCNADNPPWPTNAPTSGTQYAPSVKVGAFTIPSEYVPWVPLTEPVTAASPPSGWQVSGSTYTYNRNGMVATFGPAEGIGQVRVSFTGTDWNHPTVTVLGRNNGGTLERWTASSSWLCSGFSLADLRKGSLGKDEFFARLKSESQAVTWILRFVGFALAWFAFSRLAGPLELVADCIPCVGPCLGDSIAAIACCISCLPGCACTLGVIGVVWVAMRPAAGIPLIIIFILIMLGFVGYKAYRKQQQAGGAGSPAMDPEKYGAGASE